MPPLRKGRMPARAREGRGRPYGHRRRGATEEAAEATALTWATRSRPGLLWKFETRRPRLIQRRGVMEARRMENFITESIAKGVELCCGSTCYRC